MYRRVFLSAAVVAVCLVIFLGRAEAAVVGTYIGSHDIWIEDVFNPGKHTIACWLAEPVPGSEPWDVFGASFASGPVLCVGEQINGIPGAIECKSVDPVTHVANGLFYSTLSQASLADGTVGCFEYEPGTTNCAKSSLISRVTTISGSMHEQVMAALPPGSRVVYTTDGVWTGNEYGEAGATASCGVAAPACANTIPGCPSPMGAHLYGSGTGRTAYNAFIDQPTDVGTNVTVSSATEFFNPITFAPVPISVDVTFSEVTVTGRTMVLALSNHHDGLGGFRMTVDGFYASFLDVTTTAKYTGSITICTHYPDADNDGLIDGTVTQETEFRFLHGEDGEFVDRTTTRDAENNVICGTVDHLSPFVGAVRQTCDPTPRVDCPKQGSAGLSIVRNPADSSKNSLKVKFRGEGATLLELGDPSNYSDYMLCVYDDAGLVLDLPLLAGHAPFWKVIGNTGYKLKDKSGTNGGVTSFVLKSGSSAKFSLKGKGSNLPTPTRMPFTLGAEFPEGQVQLINDEGLCFRGLFFPSTNSETMVK